MSKKLYSLMFCLSCFCSGKAQQSLFANIPSVGKAIKDFIPANCDTLGMAIGDLNKDGKNDIALALFNKAENENSDAERLILVLFKTATGYSVAGKSANVLMCKGCGGIFGDPYAGIEISKNVLTVHHYGGSAWRWSDDLKFRYQNTDLYLIGRSAHSYWNVKMCDKLGDFAGTDIEETNFVTGDHYIKKISENCKLTTDKKNKIKIKPLVKLADYKNDN
jgi:hypothetical protein